MTTSTTPRAQNPRPPPAQTPSQLSPKTSRRPDLDNLRLILTTLVILHHTCIPYGGAGWWPQQSRLFTHPAHLLLLTVAVDQSFFMGAFFFVSGLLSAASLQRHRTAGGSMNCTKPGAGTWPFVRGKLVRLGIPTVFISGVVHGLSEIAVLPGWGRDEVLGCVVREWRTWRGVRGGAWYTALLLVFDVGAAVIVDRAFRAVTSPGTERRDIMRRCYVALSRWGWMVVAVVSFMVRLRWPIMQRVGFLSITPGYLPQYILAYTMGHVALHAGEARMWSLGETWRTGGAVRLEGSKTGQQDRATCKPSRLPSLRGAVFKSILTLNLVFLPDMLINGVDDAARSGANGTSGWTVTAVLYAIWNEYSFVTITAALMMLFEQKYNTHSITLGAWCPRYAYAAYAIHTTISIVIERVVDWVILDVIAGGVRPGWMGTLPWGLFGPVLVVAIVGPVNVLASFTVAKWFVEYVPGMKKVF